LVSQINRMEHQHSYSKYELVNMASVRLKSPLRLTPDDMALSFELSCAVALSLLIGRMPGEWLKRKDSPLRALAALIRSRTARALPRATPYPLCMLGSPPRHVYAACWHVSFARGRRSGGPGRTGARAPGAPRAVRSGRPGPHETPQEASLIYIIESSRAFPPSGDPARCAYGKGRT